VSEPGGGVNQLTLLINMCLAPPQYYKPYFGIISLIPLGSGCDTEIVFNIYILYIYIENVGRYIW